MYHKKSPIYPIELFDDLVKVSNINKDSRILEIGTNNSLATLPLLGRGINITSVEIDSENLLEDENRRRIQFKNLSYEQAKLPEYFFNLIYITKSIFINKGNYLFDKTYELLDSLGKLAIIEIKPIVIPENQIINEVEKKLLIEFFNYDENKIKELLDLSPCTCQKDLFTTLFHKVYHKKVSYTFENYIFFLNSFPEFMYLESTKKNYLIHEIESVFKEKLPNRLITKEYGFVLTVLNKKDNQLRLNLNT